MCRALYLAGALPPPHSRSPTMTREELNRELRMHSATFPAVLIVYAVIVATMVGSAFAIL